MASMAYVSVADMDEVEAMMMVLEGGCPSCQQDLVMVTVGGYPEVLADYFGSDYRERLEDEGVEVNEWNRGDPDDEWDGGAFFRLSHDGEQMAEEFKCGCGAEYYAARNRFGDWNVS
jgi:hypothetical protein